MEKYPEYFNNEIELEEAISRPTPELIEKIKNLKGDIIFLGVSGKIGISMARMTKRACDIAGIKKRIIGVSKFTINEHRLFLAESGVETIKGDLVDQEFIKSLPEVENVIYLVGMKFGTEGNEPFTWAINSYLPGLVVEKFKSSRIVAFSTGCVYGLVDVKSNGASERIRPNPIGEYAQSCMGRERLFEFGSLKNNTSVSLIRLFYAVEMRYGVLVDIAEKVFNEKPIDLTMGYFNVIWQGDANAMIIQAIDYCDSPSKIINIAGSEKLSVREVAVQFAKLMNKKVVFTGSEAHDALLADASLSNKLFGKPKINSNQLIIWTADWILNKKRILGKPTHYESRDGKY